MPKFIIAISSFIISTALISCQNFGNNPKLSVENEKNKLSYSIGYDFGKNITQMSSEIDLDHFIAGLKYAFSKTGDSLLSEAEMQASIQSFQAAKMAEYQGKMEEVKQGGIKFLEENKAKEGVTTTASGLQYRIITEGKGTKPKSNNTVKVNYRGTTIDGVVFDTSYDKKPVEFEVGGVIAGWTEVLQLMKPGSKYEVVIPSELAYGEQGAGASIPPYSVLIFEIELIEIVK